MTFCNINNNETNSIISKSIQVEHLIWTIIDGAILLIILCGNILTICAVSCCRRLSNILSNHFVLSLAVSDLLVGLTLPYHSAFYLCIGLSHDKETCVWRFVLIIIPCCASMYNLIIIAVDRYIAIVHPLHYCRYMNSRVATVTIASGWLAALFLSSIPIFWNQYDIATECELDQVLPKAYISFVLTTGFSLVWVALFALYWRIWREASGHARRLRNANNLSGGPSDRKSVQMVLLILGSFSICWLPFFVVACSRAYGLRTEESELIYKMAFSLGMANSCMNPLIYAWKNSEFKFAFGRLLKCQSPNRPQPLLTDTKDIQLHNIGDAVHSQLDHHMPSVTSHSC